jgi:hypothetical protein
MERKYVDAWRHKMQLRRAYNNFSGGGSTFMREATGNFPRRKLINHNRALQDHNLLKEYILSKNIHLPTLYKGLSGANAINFLKSVNLKKQGFLKNAMFSTRTLTSTSTNKAQAEHFTRSGPKRVLLVIPRGRRPAMIAGHFGIKARQPREREVTLPPGKFVLRYQNKTTGNFHVDFIPARNAT